MGSGYGLLRGRETEGKRETQLERKKDAAKMVSYH